MLLTLAVLQFLSVIALVVRLAPGRRRLPPEAPRPTGDPLPPTTVIVPTLNEARRIGPCLDGLLAQRAPLTEVLVVDSGSTDGTRELVEAAAHRDPRIRLVSDPPLPDGWVGKAWALDHALRIAANDHVLCMDADTRAEPGAVAAIVAGGRSHGFELVSFAPRFAGQSAGERWLQPAMLVSLVVRTGAAGDAQVTPDRILANGQCMLLDRRMLLAHGGFAPVRGSFAEDVSLARHVARRGGRVGFLDGSRLYSVEGYGDVRALWREWGRSFDLKDATSRGRQFTDVALVAGVQGLWLPLAGATALAGIAAPQSMRTLEGLSLAVSVLAFMAIRWLLLLALAPSYARRGLAWWLSPLADPLAAARLVISSLRRPRRWRSREYPPVVATPSSP